MFSKKATKIYEIFTSDLTLCSNCQIDGEDFVNFCGLFRKHEQKQLTFILSILIPKWKSIMRRSKQTQKMNSEFIDSRLSVASDELGTFFVIQGRRSMMLLHQKIASLNVHAVCISWSVALIAQLVMGRTILLIWALDRLIVIKFYKSLLVFRGMKRQDYLFAFEIYWPLLN